MAYKMLRHKSECILYAIMSECPCVNQYSNRCSIDISDSCICRHSQKVDKTLFRSNAAEMQPWNNRRYTSVFCGEVSQMYIAKHQLGCK